MQRFRPQLCAFIACATFAFAIGHMNGDDEKPRWDRTVVISYPVTDLPVCACPADGQAPPFRPTVLIALIKAHCNERPWTGVAEIAFDPDSNSLVIRQKESIHKKIAKLLEQLRVSATDEEQAQADEFERQKAHALQAMFDADQEQRAGGVDGGVAILDEALASLETSPLEPARKKRIRGALRAQRRMLLPDDARKKQLSPDQLLEYIKQMPPKQPMHVPLDLQILSNRFTP